MEAIDKFVADIFIRQASVAAAFDLKKALEYPELYQRIREATVRYKEQWGHYLRVPFLESVAWRSFLKRMAENNVESDREDPNAVDVKHEAFGE
ncbi:hypothetical protein DY000_02001137 [Brassica cretica]|uniref:Uncharacterized protein n=1 Tax=Brassica cretica TaxID=69181 RepID=A0ABQ7CJ22_BRACR|nr:hypothetical protein DY000_02001137 [Brassica cretica]